jgi:hypothetical protein
MFKSLLAAVAVATVAITASATANAKTNVDVYLGVGGFGPGYYGYYQPYYPRHHRHYGYRPVYVQPHWGISCAQGRNNVDWSGFNNVRTVECQGSSYTYRATRHGKGYVVKVGRRGGDIIAVSRAW